MTPQSYPLNINIDGQIAPVIGWIKGDYEDEPIFLPVALISADIGRVEPVVVRGDYAIASS